MWSKTWAIALAIISRLTVTNCLGPPPHRLYQSASSERVRDPEREIDAAYRMMEELGRRDALKRHKPPVQKNGGESVTEVEYVDDATEPRHRYLGNKYQPRLRFEESPDMTKSGHHMHRQGFSRTSFVGPGNLPTHGATRDGPYRHEATVDGKGPREDDPKDPAAGLGVRTRSGAESFQPIAAAVAMQENMNTLDKETAPPPPPPPPSPKHHQISSAGIQQPEPDHHHHHHDPDKVNGENKEIRPPDSSDGDGKQADPNRNGVRMMALQNPEIGSDSESGSLTEVYLLAVIAGCSVAGFVGLLVAGVCYYRLKKKVKAARDVDYPAYGVTGPNKEREGGGGGGGGGATGDRKLAQSAQMYHYQHQKQQMIASERLNSDVNHRGGSDAESEDENEEGDYTVFECPGLATNGDMEVRNPLFNEQTPVTAPLDVSGAAQTKK